MDALSLYRAGQLQPAIEALGQELRKQPLDTRRRTFLFELLCFAGEYDRAEKQLDILADASKEAAAGSLVYRSALHAERTFRTGRLRLRRGGYPAGPVPQQLRSNGQLALPAEAGYCRPHVPVAQQDRATVS